MSDLAFNPFVAQFVDEAVKKRERHLLLDKDANLLCQEIHDHAVSISPEVEDDFTIKKDKHISIDT